VTAVRADRDGDVQTIVDQARHTGRAALREDRGGKLVRLPVAHVVVDPHLDGEHVGHAEPHRGEHRGADHVQWGSTARQHVQPGKRRVHNSSSLRRHDPDQVRRSGAASAPLSARCSGLPWGWFRADPSPLARSSKALRVSLTAEEGCDE
jgi:hypothetical protein